MNSSFPLHTKRPNPRSALDARTVLFLHTDAPWPGASESERSAWSVRVKIQLFAILFGLVLLGALSPHAFGGSPTSDPRGEQFKREMLPKVGQKITMVGTITPGKFGPYLTSDRWVGIYIVTTTTNRADLAKLNVVDRLHDHTLKVVGTLHHAEARVSRNPMVSGLPDYFYFDVAEISFSEIKSTQNEKHQANEGHNNERAAGKGGIPCLLAVERGRPALPEHDR